MDIQFNFINRSDDTNGSDIVIFQKNSAPDFDDFAVAWKVIQNCGPGENHPFTFTKAMEAGARDDYGNYMPRLAARRGEMFKVVRADAGDRLLEDGAAANPAEVQIHNDLVEGPINADIYKDGKLLATKTGLAPGGKATFEFKPTLWIGAVSQIREGGLIDSAILSEINTEISLQGIVSADIVMTGGGASPYRFSLENVVTS